VKWIGFVIVPLLIAAFGVAVYAYTRPPDRDLDAQGRAWVAGYGPWSGKNLRNVRAALVRMDFGEEARNARLVEPLRGCSASLVRLGDPTELLASVRRLSLEACGRAQHAVGLTDRFGTASLASIKLHLGEAEDRLAVARRTLRVKLAEEPPQP
jgi:hypothetical protein